MSQWAAAASDVILWSGLFWCGERKCYMGLRIRKNVDRSAFLWVRPNIDVGAIKIAFALLRIGAQDYLATALSVFSLSELAWREFRSRTNVKNASSSLTWYFDTSRLLFLGTSVTRFTLCAVFPPLWFDNVATLIQCFQVGTSRNGNPRPSTPDRSVAVSNPGHALTQKNPRLF